jgi:putative FmdB family regulatory protein
MRKILKKEDFKMPLHEYKCRECNHITIKLYFGSEEVFDVTACEGGCGGVAEKIISAPGFHMKGYSAKNNYSNEDHGQGSDGPKHTETRDPKGKRYDKHAPPPKRMTEAQIKKAKSTLDD